MTVFGLSVELTIAGLSFIAMDSPLENRRKPIDWRLLASLQAVVDVDVTDLVCHHQAIGDQPIATSSTVI